MSDLADKLVDRMLNPDQSKLIQDVIDIEIEKSRADASQSMTDAATDRQQLGVATDKAMKEVDDPRIKNLLLVNFQFAVEGSKPKRRRR
jgi:hypothetical protein